MDKAYLQQVLEGFSPQGKDVFLDIETFEGTSEALEKDIAWALREERAAIAELREEAMAAQDILSAYQDECQEKGEKPLKKDMADWEKAIDKCEKAELKLAEKEIAIREKAALQMSAQIIAVSVVTEKHRMIFAAMPLSVDEAERLKELGITPVTSEYEVGEAGILSNLADYLNSIEPIAHIYTWNGYGFDIPRLRLRMGVNRVKKPVCLSSETDVNFYRDDLMIDFARHYLGDRTGYCKLPRACDLLSLDSSKIGDGSEIDGLYREGKWVELLAYCVLDSVVLQQIKHIIHDL